MTTADAIEVHGLRRAYGDHLVLDDIDLRVRAGSVFALLGPNGAGKTTMVNILSTLIQADAGELRVGGHDVSREPAALFDQSYDWAPDDPRIEAMADLMIGYMTEDEDRMRATLDQPPIEDALAGLLDAQSIQAAPAWRRLEQVLIARGYTGWTNVARTEPIS